MNAVMEYESSISKGKSKAFAISACVFHNPLKASGSEAPLTAFSGRERREAPDLVTGGF